MIKLSKRMKLVGEIVKPHMTLGAMEAFKLLKEASKVKFNESVDVNVKLGIDTKKSDQTVRSAVVLPKGTGKTVKVAVFAQGAQAEAAKNAGADVVGFEDLAALIQSQNFDFDILIATPEAMPLVGKLGQILGPKGLMPNPKVGTVTTNVELAVQNARAGQVSYRADKSGYIHCRLGTVQFSIEDLKENLTMLISDIKKHKPASSKGIYLQRVIVSTTMGPGIIIDLAEFS